MSIWNKILLGFIFVASLAFFYLATRTLATHHAWRVSAQAFQKALDEAKQEEVALREGSQEGEELRLGIRQLRLELHKLMLARGRVWYAAVPGQVDANTGEVMVSIDTPDPHQISKEMTLYVFENEQAKDGGQYVGQFKVTGADQKQVTLKPVFNLARTIEDAEGNKRKAEQRKLDRLAQSKGRWDLYERMPGDNHEIFTSLSEEELRELVPEELLAEYLKDGKPAEPGDPEDCVDADKNYVRELIDYGIVFTQNDVERSELVDRLQAEMRDRKSVQEALADAKEQHKFHTKANVAAKDEQAKMFRQRDAVLAHLAEVQKVLTDKEGQIQSTVSTIQAMVGEISKIQLEATRRINQRTRALMQAGAGR